MQTDSRYPIPAGPHRSEEEIKRSRFITSVAHTPTVDEAKGLFDGIRAEFPDASHNCWAYLIGRPGSSGQVGMSDDGEPHGTAGRPMLGVLTHSGVGDVAAVVTRYFGGTKLGKGGLVRAYSGGVQAALKTLPLKEHIVYAIATVVVAYAHADATRRLLPEFEVETEEETFGADVELRVKLPQERLDELRVALNELTNGQVLVDDEV
ncbi:MAG: YigZ family protein [Candidatus Latescibacteria bacterium]|jgi:uncharacterized YigZ family protein|nr:YigZ family protein [Candidatus Latescibacterota bacterium]